MSGASSPSILRWLFVGVPCYGSWLLVNLLLVLLFPLYFVIELVGRRPGRRLLRRIGTRFIRGFFIHHLPLLGVYRVEKSADIKALRQTGPCLLVANHTSWLDALILFSLVPYVRILVSSRYRNVPLVRHPMRWLECIFVDRRSRASILESIQEIKNGYDAGAPVAVFPEGTRGRVGQLKPLQDVFFRIAVDAGMPVQPVLLYLDQPFLGPGAENFLTRRGATLKIRVLDRIVPEPGEGARDMAFRVRAEMRRALKALVEASGEIGAQDA